MSTPILDEYALALDGLSAALESSFTKMKESSLSRENLDYSNILLARLRAFYCAQDNIKKFLGKRVAQAGADFFVEGVLFSLKLFNEIENLNFQIISERAIQHKRKAIRPDISIWRGDRLLAVVECKTQLGWMRSNWKSHFAKRERDLKEACPEAKLFVLVMTSCNWSGFDDQLDSSEVNQQFFCLLKDIWPTQIPEVFNLSLLESPIENLLQQVEKL
ncbi:MAG: hypothetical protein WBA57_06000 [Elainellaceae cyanobacterium]